MSTPHPPREDRVGTAGPASEPPTPQATPERDGAGEGATAMTTLGAPGGLGTSTPEPRFRAGTSGGGESSAAPRRAAPIERQRGGKIGNCDKHGRLDCISHTKYDFSRIARVR